MFDFENEDKIYNQRSDFLKNLSSRPMEGDRLIKKLRIRDDLHYLLRSACFNYITSSMLANQITVEQCDNFDSFIIKNSKKISTMHNVTPNGVIRPKYENLAEFNLVQKYLNLILDDIGILGNVNKIRAPISIRIVTSDDDPSILKRPRANNRLHSDFWTGAVCDFAVLVPIFGSLDTIDVVFCEPNGITRDYLREYPSYADGEKTYKNYTEYKTVMQHGNIYLQDIFCLHGTRRTGKGARVSIDFTLQSKLYDKNIKEYYSNTALLSDNHLDVEEWSNIGYSNIFYETEKISDLKNINNYTSTSLDVQVGSAIRLQTSKTAKIVCLDNAREVTTFESKITG
jgi:hypothetical protein